MLLLLLLLLHLALHVPQELLLHEVVRHGGVLRGGKGVGHVVVEGLGGRGGVKARATPWGRVPAAAGTGPAGTATPAGTTSSLPPRTGRLWEVRVVGRGGVAGR